MTRQHLMLATLTMLGCSDGDSQKTQVQGRDSGSVTTTDCTNGPAETQYADLDGDGFGDPTQSREGCGAEEGWVTNDLDCDDTDGSIHPNSAEICDEVDNNCDGVPDDDSATDATNWFNDADGDGFGAGPPRGFGCNGTEGQVNRHGDCDDTDPEINPDGSETCDGLDNDCNGEVDDGETADGEAFYEDSDGDGWGNSEIERIRGEQPSGWVSQPGDCDDDNELFHPAALDVCADGLDQNCDGHIDDRCGETIDLATSIKIEVPDSLSPGAVSGRDVNGDSIADLLVFLPMDHKAVVYLGPFSDDRTVADVTLESSDDTLLPGAGVHSENDFDGDGEPDLLVTTPRLDPSTASFSTSVRLYTNTGIDTMALDEPHSELTSTTGGEYWGSGHIQSGDITGDGTIDAVLTRAGGNVFIWDDPTTDFVITESTPVATFPAMVTSMSPAIGDYNADGQADLVVPTGDNLVAFSGPVDPLAWYDEPADTWESTDSSEGFMGMGLCMGDLSGDGTDDLVYTEERPSEGTEDRVHIDSFDSDTFGPTWTYLESYDGSPITLKCTDIDGDGQVDLLIQNFAASTPTFSAGRTSLFFGPIHTGTFDELPDRIVEGDLAGDALGFVSDTADLTNDGINDLILSSVTKRILIIDGSDWISPAWPAESGD